MISSDKYIKDMLSGYAPLIALIGSANQIIQSFPKAFETLPIVSFECANDFQENKMTFDNIPYGSALAYNIDVWHSNTASPTAIINAVTSIMNLNGWFRTANRPVDDLNDEICRRHLVFTASKLYEQLDV
jgi:hypothetical protein